MHEEVNLYSAIKSLQMYALSTALSRELVQYLTKESKTKPLSKKK